ncbi:hypothetical protein HYPSUDRAFT_202733 [Hypholoma sublateritium FD-334 SS-4]|uniref:Uncharacterized protein n=1 Tax=Hypholoma sublateritium (strain FD-334 SS-4) TaxID=945553 RepID=A0A0D2PPL6_HYPSF|nr:hypothetical protein HYPSUDRAFT_202733 [Hypholoma sublateritium FD-334 SS-4]
MSQSATATITSIEDYQQVALHMDSATPQIEDCRQVALQIAEEQQKRCLDLLKSAPRLITHAKEALSDYEMALKNLEEFVDLDEKTPVENQPVSFRKLRPYEKAVYFLILDLLLITIGAPATDHGVLFLLYLIAVESA